jgi:1-deoxy-D-xylulose-5-phosphate reductoisomerase
MSARLAVLGSTGSIGVQALEIATREPARVRVVALAAGSNLDALESQARRFQPAHLALERHADPRTARARLLAAAPEAQVELGPGSAARLAEACGAEVVLNGIVGSAGLEASLATLSRGARLALANKETLVVGGELVRRQLERGGELIPVDSEHSAALQCLAGRPGTEVARLVLTASGGALRDHADWRRATPAEVLAHPVWSMGRRITVDSALLVNKAFEMIEARWLFALEWRQLEAWLHPQAIVHALVTFTDGSTVAQAARPDMRLPIQLALSWPSRWGEAIAPLTARELSALSFEPLVAGRWPAYDLALAAGRAGGTAPCVLNAADEEAVEMFLTGRITLAQVPQVMERVLESHAVQAVESFAQLRELDAWARAEARTLEVRS